MKLNQSQTQSLQTYLKNNLKYRETYAEFYDHLLTGLENTPSDVSFKDAVHNIIANDFGGLEGMGVIEEKYKRSIFIELKKRYLNYAAGNFKLPGIFITAAIIALMCIMVKQPWFSLEVFLLNILAIRAIPSILYMVTRLRSPRIQGAPIRSIKSSFFKWQNSIPAVIFFVTWSVAFPGPIKDQLWMQKIIVPVMTVVLIMMALLSLTYYKVYRDDIKAKFKVS